MARTKRRDIFTDLEELRLGLVVLEDTTKAPFGSARTMRNVQLTDRGGISPRPGTLLLGDNNTSNNPVRGLYNFRTSFEQDELLVKTYDDEVEIYSKNNAVAKWWRLKDSFTSDKEFGFVTSLVNEENIDTIVFCNRYEEQQRWTGALTTLNGALAGAETTLVVDSTLTAEIFEAKTATASSTTTLDVAGTPWAASQWVGLYVLITSGAQSGQIRKISANTTSQITFTTMTDPGNATFEIRKLIFQGLTGSVIYNGTVIAYTGITTSTGITVASAHAGADGDIVAEVPDIYAGSPRGNRLTNYLGRIVVGNVRSAIARDSGGALQGYASGGSYFVSQVNDPTDYDFSASRVAGEGDIVGTPYGGKEITDVAHQEDTAYVFKPRYIEAMQYTQDTNDLAVRTPLKAEIGSVGQVINGSDDIYFITADNKITSLGRVRAKDSTPQTENMGHRIKRLLDGYVFGTGRGIEFKDRLYFPAKSSSAATTNDILLVYNKAIPGGAFEGIWEIPINYLEEFDDKLYMGQSVSANVFQMLVGTADVIGDNRFAITAEYATNFYNLASSDGVRQSLQSMYVEGYIKGGTTITFNIWKDFDTSASISFDFGGTEEQFLDGVDLSQFLGANPLGLNPIGAIGEPDGDGRRHFYFRVYFPFVYGNHFSYGFQSSGIDDVYEITRFGLGLSEDVSTDVGKVKSI